MERARVVDEGERGVNRNLFSLAIRISPRDAKSYRNSRRIVHLSSREGEGGGEEGEREGLKSITRKEKKSLDRSMQLEAVYFPFGRRDGERWTA